MADPKTAQYTQFARVGNPDGSSPIAAASPNQALAPLVDEDGRLIVVPFTGAPIPTGDLIRADSGGAALTLQAKASAGRLYQAWGTQIATAILWLQLFDLAAGPPAGSPFVAPIPILQNGIWSFAIPNGLALNIGILLALSTTAYTYTAPAAGGWFTALYN